MSRTVGMRAVKAAPVKTEKRPEHGEKRVDAAVKKAVSQDEKA